MRIIFGRPKTCSAILVAAPILWFLCLVSTSLAEPAPSTSATKRFALLVGCTKYPYCTKVRELYGPPNDVPAFAQLLEKRFGFDRGDIRTLLAWPDDLASRPTNENIAAAFKELIAKSEEGSQIVILMSGHGTQVPDDGDEENDGLDEAFLPADARPWSGDHLPNAIRDDQFGQWFDALRQKGAHVWVIFDCCHAGTMTKAIDDDERMRTARPDELAIPATAFHKKARPQGATPERALDVTSNSGTGSLTEFYAAQSFEEAPELPRPAQASRNTRKYYGLFTYMLVQALEQRGGSLSYADLSRAIINCYRAERGSRSPTPFFAGDLGREVLGLQFWPNRHELVLQDDKGAYRIEAGEIQGITPGSIFVITARGGDKSEVLGYARATDVTPTSSVVEPCEHGAKPAVTLDRLPKDAHCRLLVREIGDMRVKLGVRHSSDPVALPLNQVTDQALLQLPAEIRSLVDRTEVESTAAWLLHVVSPSEASNVYGRKLDKPAVVLVQTSKQSGDTSSALKIWTTYSTETLRDAKQIESLSAQLANDLQKIFTWQNIWRVAGRTGGSGDSDLTLEVSRRDPPPAGGPPRDPNILHLGERISVTISNDGIDNWWITLLHLDPHFGIDVWLNESIDGKRKFKRPINATLSGKSLGPEGIVLLAAPMAVQKQKPDYTSLEQTPLGDHGQFRSMKGASLTPLGRLLAGASLDKGTRGSEGDSPEHTQIVMRSWLTLPERQK